MGILYKAASVSSIPNYNMNKQRNNFKKSCLICKYYEYGKCKNELCDKLKIDTFKEYLCDFFERIGNNKI